MKRWIVVSLCLVLPVLGSSAEEADDGPTIVYPKHTDLDFAGTDVDGELKRPADLYFQHRPTERFDSLLKRRKEFHRAMLRDVTHE